MNRTRHETSKEEKKRAPATKYNKLTREQKMAIIEERAETHMPFASIASLFSAQFGMTLSTRGVADIVSFWRENGKLRGESNAVAAQNDIVNALNVVKDICIRYGCSLEKAELNDFISFLCAIDSRVVPKRDMMWLDHVCDGIQKATEASKSIPSFSQYDRDRLSPVLSMYDSSSVYYVCYFPCCLSCFPNTIANVSLPNQIWTVVARDGTSPLSPVVSSSFSGDSFFSRNSSQFPSPAAALLSLLRDLDERVSSPSIVLYCDVMQMASVSDNGTSQEVTLKSAEDLSPFCLPLFHTRLFLTSLPLFSFSTLSGIFRLFLKTHLLTSPDAQPLSDAHIAEAWSSALSVVAGPLLESQPLSFTAMADLRDTPAVTCAEAYCRAFSEYCAKEQVDEKTVTPDAFFHVEDAMRSAGVDAVCFRALLHCLEEENRPTAQQTQKEGNESASGMSPSEYSHLMSAFRNTYESLLASLPDVCYDDYERMDAFFAKISKGV